MTELEERLREHFRHQAAASQDAHRGPARGVAQVHERVRRQNRGRALAAASVLVVVVGALGASFVVTRPGDDAPTATATDPTPGVTDSAGVTTPPVPDLSRPGMAALRDRLDCGAKRSTFFTYDQSEPPAETTIETALGKEAAEATVVQQSADRALVEVQRGGGTVAALIVYQWPNGGWAVESGNRCAP